MILYQKNYLFRKSTKFIRNDKVTFSVLILACILLLNANDAERARVESFFPPSYWILIFGECNISKTIEFLWLIEQKMFLYDHIIDIREERVLPGTENTLFDG